MSTKVPIKVLITMAGKGSRFRDVGIKKPKHEIRVRDRPMFDWAMKSMNSFFDSEFIFVTQERHSAGEFLRDACNRLGIERYQEIALSEYTNGQAATAIAADELIDDDEGVAIYNIDTYIQEGNVTPGDIGGDGFIPVFNAPGERWSFVRENDQGEVAEVSEKEKISDLATAGFYYFDRWDNFTTAYHAQADVVKSRYGETYVAPLYNHLIQHGKEVITQELDRSAIHVLGTPTDLQQFDPGFNS